MPDTRTFVIVGAGLTGATAAATLREEGFDGRILLVGDEPERPYERPPLSKAVLRGERARESAHVHAESFYADHAIELRTGTPVTAIHPAAGAVELAGTRIRYDRLLLATGSAPRGLPVPGAALHGVHYLRTLADADALGARLRGGPLRLVVIGAGWIGMEVAASARQLGHEVTIVELEPTPLAHAFGPEVGAIFAAIHADHGVRVLTGVRVAAVEGAGMAEHVRLDDGRRLPCDLVVVGVGAAPRTELAEAAGLAVENGILVNALLETSAPGVFAAGDVANAVHPLLGGSVRVEHWANARNQGPAAARAMLGVGSPYDRLPYFFSDQYDVGIEYSGLVRSWARVVFRGDPATRRMMAFWIEDGRVRAGLAMNVWDVQERVQALVRSGRPVDERRLADPDVPLEDLVAETARA